MKVTKPWTVLSELCGLANCDSLEDATVKMGLIEVHLGEGLRTAEVQPWHRSGSETYSYVFDLIAGGISRGRFRLKACAPTSFNRPISATLEDWISRRILLSNEGIHTPRLFAWGNGILLEEEIPYSLDQAIGFQTSREPIRDGLAQVMLAIVKLGFRPINTFSDVRSRGSDCVMLDFGSDLGPPNLGITNAESIFISYLQKLDSLGVLVDAQYHAKLRELVLAISDGSIH